MLAIVATTISVYGWKMNTWRIKRKNYYYVYNVNTHFDIFLNTTYG